MIAFEIYLNGKQICTAGVGDRGVLSTHVCWFRRDDKVTKLPREDLSMHVGGLLTPSNEHISWHEHRPLQVGDQVCIKVVETETVDEPAIRKPNDPAYDEEQRKRYLRETAKEFGWTLLET